MKQKTIMIDEQEYVRADSIKEPAQKLDGLEYCIVRTYSAGVFAGYVKERKGKEGTILNARRLYYWSGASTLSQLAMEGVKNPDECKFPCEVDEIILTEIIEVIPAKEEARLSIKSVRVWEQS